MSAHAHTHNTCTHARFENLKFLIKKSPSRKTGNHLIPRLCFQMSCFVGGPIFRKVCNLLTLLQFSVSIRSIKYIVFVRSCVMKDSEKKKTCNTLISKILK